jgi:Glycosyl hydrolase family 79 C-terminal beta domain
VHALPLSNYLKKCLPIFIGLTMLGCKKDDIKSSLPVNDSIPLSATPIATVPITVKVDQTQRGFPVPKDFEGLSYETGLLTESPDFLNENNAVFIQLIKNLGSGVLRIGGNTSDEIDWSDNARTPETPLNLLTTSDIDRLSAFSKTIGWPVLFGLNLGNNNATVAANEALYVHNSLQNSLYALQSGNEPDVFNLKLRKPTYSFQNFLQEWNTYFSAVKAKISNERFAGPDVDPFNPSWLSSFAASEHSNIRLIDGHYYNTGPATDANITYHTILGPNTKLNGYLLQLSNISSKYHLPYRITECNSVWAGGKAGVSDVFASSLWALDYMWNVAENKGQGVNFHGGGPRFVYTPIASENGTYTARPEYYAMLAFKYGSTGGSIIPATIADPRASNNCTVYACANADNTYSITLINKEEAKNFAFTIQLNKIASTIKIARLRAPSVTSKKYITFAGSTVNADGTFTASTNKTYPVNKNSFVVTVLAGSAAVVTVN